MTSLLTITFSNTGGGGGGGTSVLQTHFLPEITLDDDCGYSCAFLDLIIKTTNDDDLNKIADLGVLCVNCDVISGSYINGERRHVIHQFATSASHMKGRILVEIPKNLNYFPIKYKNLHSIQISIVDQNGKPIDIYGGEIICRINIKRDKITSVKNNF